MYFNLDPWKVSLEIFERLFDGDTGSGYFVVRIQNGAPLH